jgi:hypothetical protein
VIFHFGRITAGNQFPTLGFVAAKFSKHGIFPDPFAFKCRGHGNRDINFGHFNFNFSGF